MSSIDVTENVHDPLTLLCAASDVPPSGGKRVELESRPPIAVFRIGNEFFAIDDLCTHAGASLSEGEVIDGQLFCPAHSGKFDLRSGKALEFPATEDLRTYAVVLSGGSVFVSLRGQSQ